MQMTQIAGVIASIYRNTTAAPETVGGVTIGAAGTGLYAGFRLVAGDDFDMVPTRWSARQPTGKYMHSGFTPAQRWQNSSDNAMYVDPQWRGSRSQSKTDLNIDRVSIAGGVATLTASAPEAGLTEFLPTSFTAGGDAAGRPRLLTGSLKTAPHYMISAQADFIIECRVQTDPGVAAGYWPSFWCSTFYWPDLKEIDLLEVRKYGTGQIQNLYNLIGQPGVSFNYQAGDVPSTRMCTLMARKIGGVLEFYDDFANAGVLVKRFETNSAELAQMAGPHDLRMDMAVNNTWDSSTFDAAHWPKSVKFDWWRAWAPASAGDNQPVVVLPAVNTTPGGSWSASLPSLASLYGGKPGIEQALGCYDNEDCPGRYTRDRTMRRPGGMSVDLAARTVSGTVPITEGGRTFLMLAHAYNDGTPAARVLLPYNVAPAIDQAMVPQYTLSYGQALSGAVPYNSMHSGNLGPHNITLSVPPSLSWLTAAADGNGGYTLSGTAPNAEVDQLISLSCTNSIGQTTTTSVRIVVTNSWTPAKWASVRGWWDASDNATVFSNTGGTTQSVVGGAVQRVNDKSGQGNHLTGVASYITDAIFGKLAIKFTAANSNRLGAVSSSLANAATGGYNGYSVVMVVRRGTPGVSTTPCAFSNDATPTTRQFHRFALSSANGVAMAQALAATATTQISSTAVASDTWYVVRVLYTGRAFSAWVNGVKVADALPLANDGIVFNRFDLGAVYDAQASGFANFFDGAIGEIMVVDEAVETGTAVRAEQYLTAKWLS